MRSATGTQTRPKARGPRLRQPPQGLADAQGKVWPGPHSGALGTRPSHQTGYTLKSAHILYLLLQEPGCGQAAWSQAQTLS